MPLFGDFNALYAYFINLIIGLRAVTHWLKVKKPWIS